MRNTEEVKTKKKRKEKGTEKGGSVVEKRRLTELNFMDRVSMLMVDDFLLTTVTFSSVYEFRNDSMEERSGTRPSLTSLNCSSLIVLLSRWTALFRRERGASKMARYLLKSKKRKIQGKRNNMEYTYISITNYMNFKFKRRQSLLCHRIFLV